MLSDMDALHERIARVALAVAADYGFCLAGGYAVQAHGFLIRRSEDVDLFTTMDIDSRFGVAVRAVTAALEDDGLVVLVDKDTPTFARLTVGEPGGPLTKLELGVDWREYPPLVLDIGPVLHPDDAVANKVCALYGRGELRDYVDVGAVLASGRYTSAALTRLAVGHDPGLDVRFLAHALAAVSRFRTDEFARYSMDQDQVESLRGLLNEWSRELTAEQL